MINIVINSVASAVILLMGIGEGPASNSFSPGDTPRVEKWRNFFGQEVKVEIYSRDKIELDIKNLSIAQRKFLKNQYKEIFSTPSPLKMQCRVDKSGISELDNCIISDINGKYLQKLSHGTLQIIRFSQQKLPTLSEKIRFNEKYPRYIELLLDILGTDYTDPELMDGPIVDLNDIVDRAKARSSIDYPPSAKRAELGGKLTALCQVETDLSVSCKQTGFEPVENESHFSGIAPRLMLAGRVGPQLRSGPSSVGVRFTVTINFVLHAAGDL